MGYLTTFTIYNDGVDLVKKHPEEFAEKIVRFLDSEVKMLKKQLKEKKAASV